MPLETIPPTIESFVETTEATVPQAYDVLIQNDHFEEYMSQLGVIYQMLSDLMDQNAFLLEFGKLAAGILVFFLVCVLCHYIYKFFRIFF